MNKKKPLRAWLNIGGVSECLEIHAWMSLDETKAYVNGLQKDTTKKHTRLKVINPAFCSWGNPIYAIEIYSILPDHEFTSMCNGILKIWKDSYPYKVRLKKS